MTVADRANFSLPAIAIDDREPWDNNSIAEDYAVSPVDIIRSFLEDHNRVFRPRRGWADALVIEPQAWYLQTFISTRDISAFDFGHSKFATLNFELPSDPIVQIEFLTHSDVSDQLSLSLSNKFAPSAELLDLWVESVKAFATDSKIPEVYTTVNAPRSELRELFIKKLMATFGVIAQPLRYNSDSDIEIAKHGRFNSRFQLEISEQFLIGGYEANLFLTKLLEELISAITTGAEIKASWGQVILTSSNDLSFELNKADRAIDPSFVRASRVE